jgi:thiol-disulfide isomerase/thioredoxin
MNQKYKPLIWLGIIIVLAIVLIVLGTNPQWFKSKGSIVLSDGTMIGKAYFTDKVIVIHSPSCPHCLVVVPIMRQIEQDTNKTFFYYDVTKPADIQELTKLNLVPEAVPTVIIYGKVLVGERTPEEYLALINKKK